MTSIGEKAFYNCSGLASVSIGNSVTSIGKWAFRHCSNLTSITFPNSTINTDNSFLDCNKLSTIIIGDTKQEIIKPYIIFDRTGATYRLKVTISDFVKSLFNIETVKVEWSSNNTNVARVDNYGNVTAVGEGATEIIATIYPLKAKSIIVCSTKNYIYVGGIYYLPYSDGHAEVTNITLGYDTGDAERTDYKGTINIPTSVNWNGRNYNVTGIHAYAFKRMRDLQSVVVPPSITEIGSSAFRNSEKLGRVLFMNPNDSKLTKILISTFRNCSSLDNVVLPNSVKSIGEYAFAGCTSLKKLQLSSSLTTIAQHAFENCTALPTLNMPDKVSTVDNYAFNNCTSLTTIVFSPALYKINQYSFANCTSLPTIQLPEKLTFIDEFAFTNCTSLASAYLPESLGSIQNYAFSNDKSLKEISFPSQLQGIGAGCFLNCTGLQTVTFNTTLATMTVGADAFDGCTKLNRVNVKDLGSLAHTNFNTENSNPLSLAHHLYQNNKELTTAKVPEGTMYVNNYAFSGCTSLTEISLPSTIQYVNDNIFYNCTALTTVRCKAEMVPPFLGTDDPAKMNNVFSKATLYVPEDVVDDYKADDWWKRFSKITEIGDTSIPGDVNGDESVNTSDVVSVYTFIISGDASGISKKAADVNANGEVNSADVVAIYNIIITGNISGQTAKVTSVSLNKTTLTLTSAGQTSQLTATVSPTNATNKSVTWTSSNTSVASVDANGLVTAKATGTATITATAADGSGKKATCTVTVSINTTVEVKYVSLNKTTLTLTSTGQTSQLTPRISPTNATNKSVTWTSSNTSVATVDANGLVTAKATGTATITATAADGSGKKATCTVTVNIEVSEFVVNGIKYSLTGNKTVKVAKDSYSGDIVIPSSVTYGGTTYSVTAIGDYVFNGCSGLTSVTIPNSVTTIGTSAFQGCTSLEGLYISDLAAYCDIDIPASSTTASPIYYAKNLYLNGQLVVNLIVPEGVTKLGNHIFDGCTSIKDVTLPEGLTTIGQGALAIPNMEEVTLPSTVIEIGHFALRSNCLSKIVAKMEDPSAITMGSSCFTDEAYSEVTLYVPPTAINAYKSTKPWSNFSNITPISNNAVEYISEGRYVIVSAGKGPGYYTSANPGDQYDNENKFALYNKDGLVKWKTYDETDDSFVYQITSDENGGWYIYNIADSSYIDRQSSEGKPLGQSFYGGSVTTSTTKNTPQLIEATNKSGKWTIRFKDNQYVYSLTPSHNGAVGTSGFISIWGSNTEAQQYGMNVWYLYKVK